MNTMAGTRVGGMWGAIVSYIKDFKVLKETKSEYWGIQVINFVDCTIYFALLSVAAVFLSQDLGMDDKNAGYVVTIFTSATTIFLFVSGMVTDWLGIRKSLYWAMGALLLLRMGLALIGLVDTIPYRGIIAGIIFFLMAPFMAMIITIFQAANRRFTNGRSRSAGFNLWYLFMNVGAAAGGFMIDIIRKWLELPNAYIFVVGVGCGIVSLIATFLMIKDESQMADPDEKLEETKPSAEVKPRKGPFQIAREVMIEPVFWRLMALILLLVGVRAVFAYMYLLMPKYWLRVIGPDAAFGTLEAINPIIIVVGLFLFIPFASKYDTYKMLIYGAVISAFSMLVLIMPWRMFSGDIAIAHYSMAVICLVILSIGEIIWSPKLSEYTAAVAPEGQEGTYLGISMIPWFLAKTLVSVFSGHMLIQWAPEGIGERMQAGAVSFWDSPSAMWLVLSIPAILGPIVALTLRGWFTKGVKLDKKGEDTKK